MATINGSGTIFGTETADTIFGSAGVDHIHGLGGDDILFGFDGDDHIYGGFGRDNMNGGNGSDTVYFTHSSSFFVVDLAADTAVADGLSETIVFIENVVMGSGGSQVIGDAGQNFLTGGSGADSLKGGDGNDHIVGGGGTDTAVFSFAYGNYVVTQSGSDLLVNHSSEGTDRVYSDIDILQFADVSKSFAQVVQDITRPTVSISGSPTVNEGGTLTFTVTRNGGNTSQPLTVFYSTSGQAQSGSDYTAPPGSVTIAAGSTFAQINISTLNDGIDEANDNESLTVTLSSSSNYILGTSTATGTIHDINVTAQLPDLIIEDVFVGGQSVAQNTVAPGSYAIGQQFSVTYDVRNIGPGPAVASTAAVYMSINGTLTRLDTETTTSLPGGSQDGSKTLSFVIPAGLAAGTHAIAIQADDGNSVTEVDDGNNAFGFLINVTQPVGDAVREGTDTTTNLALGVALNGRIDAEPISGDGETLDGTGGYVDKDWYKIALTAGRTYTFEGTAGVSASDTLDSLFIRVRDGNGNLLPVDKAAAGATPSFTFTPSTSDTYHLAVSADGVGDTWRTKTGDYQVKVTDVGAQSAYAFDVVAKTVGESDGGVTFNLTRTNTVGNQTVYVSTVQNWNGNGAYNQGDYTGKDGVNVTFLDGSATATAPITIAVTPDLVPEQTQTFGLIVQTDRNAPANEYVAFATFTITDDDSTTPPPGGGGKTAEQLFAIKGGQLSTLSDFALAAYDNASGAAARTNLTGDGWSLLEAGTGAGKLNGLDPLASFSNGMFTLGTAAALVASSKDALVVSFRGTDSWLDAITGWATPVPYYAQYSSLIAAIDNYIAAGSQQITTVYVSGHSLGGGMAHSFMQAHDDGYKSRAYSAATFASPGSSVSSDQDSRTVNFRNEDDPIRIVSDGDLVINVAAVTLALSGYPNAAKNLYDLNRVYPSTPGDNNVIFFGEDNYGYLPHLSQHYETIYNPAIRFIAHEVEKAGLDFSAITKTYDKFVVPASYSSAIVIGAIPQAELDVFGPITTFPAISSDISLISTARYFNFGWSDDTITGISAKEILLGGLFADQLNGGLGDDLLLGGDGDDSYFFTVVQNPLTLLGQYNGADTIRDSEGTEDTIRLGSGTSFNPKDVTKYGDDIQILYGTGAAAKSSITIPNYESNHIEKIEWNNTTYFIENIAREHHLVDVNAASATATTAGSTLSAAGLLGYSILGNFSSGLLQFRSLVGLVAPATGVSSLATTAADPIDGTTQTISLFANLIGTDGGDAIIGDDQGNLFDGGAGDDQIDGGDGSDALYGGSGADNVSGGAGDDALEGGAGNDALDGGLNSDTAVYSGAWVEYTVTGTGPFTITDTRGGSPDGTDTVSNVENFAFSNGTFSSAQIGNDAPLDMAFSSNAAAENAANGTVVATLTTTDADSPLGDTATYTLTSDAGGRFAIAGSMIVVTNGGLLNFEAATSHQVSVRVTDAKGLTYDESFAIDVTNQNEVPASLTVTPQAVTENVAGATAAAFNLADPDTVASGFATYTYQITGEQASKFEVSGTTIRLIAGQSLDFEADSSLNLTLTATNTNNASHVIAQNFTVNVNNANEAPASLTVTPQAVTENVAGATAATFNLADPDTAASGFANYTYQITGEQASKFEVSGTTIRLIAGQSLDFEADSSLNLTLTATNTNNASHVIAQNFTVNVTDANGIHLVDGDTANTLSGTSENDWLEGRGGNDILIGGAGPDTLDGGAGFDFASYRTSTGAVRVDLGNPANSTGDAVGDSYVSIEIFELSGHDDRFDGGTEAKLVYGRGGTDLLNGGSADDVLFGGAGGDSLNGGGGTDTVSYADAAAGVNLDLVTPANNTGDAVGDSFVSIERFVLGFFADTFTGTAGNDWVRGLAGADTLSGGAGNDTINGEDGDDTIIDGAGNDVVNGGLGNDAILLSADSVSDTVDGGPGSDKIDLFNAVTPTTVTFGATAFAGTTIGGGLGLNSFTGIERVLGSNLADTVTGGGGAEFVFGRNGNDVISGRGGNDTISGDGGADALNGEDGDDVIIDGAGNDVVNGGLGNDAIFLSADSVSDTVDGGAGSDKIDLFSAVTPTTVTFGATAFAGTTVGGGLGLNSFTGIERVLGSNLADTVNGGAGAEFVFGRDGNDTIFGGQGNDTIYGDIGNDRLTGAAGADFVHGGAGNDTFVFSHQSQGADTFGDFATGADKIEIARAGFGLGAGYALVFQTGAAAVGAAPVFLFNPAAKQFLFDADGGGAVAAVLLATLSVGSIAAGDILLV